MTSLGFYRAVPGLAEIGLPGSHYNIARLFSAKYTSPDESNPLFVVNVPLCLCFLSVRFCGL